MEVVVLTHIFCKKGVTHLGFVVPIFEGGDLCDIDGKTYAFHFRLSAFKRNLENGNKNIFYNNN